ncbi:hypothetical protein M378DRAFT_21594 [Amanita muscaria Koide BX008]|uniref:Uncharacterized protein n=1 Tax=Amanita muscaria (strain Koide BX008) TaxID=946122 RepID=A0A0C2TQB4_AMAMK|nr:hypothetical protein M378DRAFT_21594 [Amanita muscaria Koide BX008]
MVNQSGSRRWIHFHSALQLAVQRSAHKWTFEDFTECFPSYVEEDRNGASATFNSIADYIEAQNIRDLDKLSKDYNVQENVDTLHRIVLEAKERKASGEVSKDAWRQDLDPRTAVCARTIPQLESEVQRLRESLVALETENRKLQATVEENTKATDAANQRSKDLLDKLDATHSAWEKLPMDDIETWTAQTAESLGSSIRS